jgi:hypothetical protein
MPTVDLGEGMTTTHLKAIVILLHDLVGRMREVLPGVAWNAAKSLASIQPVSADCP